MDQEEYLRSLQEDSRHNGADQYLWPRTAMGNMQAEITARVGASDWLDGNLESRPGQIIGKLDNLIYNRLLPEDFTCLDICCGDGLILWQIKRAFPFSKCYGLDLNTGLFETHQMVREMGVKLYRGTIQRLFERGEKPLFDLAIMLNTYRGWGSADLREDEKHLPAAADLFFRYHTRYTILTLADDQSDRLRAEGFWVDQFGKGEDDSIMALIFPCGDLWRAGR